MQYLAPIGISAYNRIKHLRKTIKALQKNSLAKKSELYIFSDAPKKGDEEIVSGVRNYIKTFDGFKKVHIIEREKNDRVTNNRDGMKQLLDEYGKMIWLEDDIVTAPGFLSFMNDALSFYKDDERILSISGYCPPIKIPDDYREDIFLLKRFSAWGFATWDHKFDPFGFELKKHGIDKFFSNEKEIIRYQQNGKDMLKMLIKEYNGEIDALDIKLMFYQFQYNLFTIYPSKSLVRNIGFDGSGLHCGISDKFNIGKLWDKKEEFELKKDIQVDGRIRKSNFEFRSYNKEYMDLSIKLLDYIKKRGLQEIVVYGAGDVGYSLVKALNSSNIKVNCVVDKNESLWGSFIENVEIKSFSEAVKQNIDTYVIASLSFLNEIVSTIEKKYSNSNKKPTIISYKDIEMDL